MRRSTRKRTVEELNLENAIENGTSNSKNSNVPVGGRKKARRGMMSWTNNSEIFQQPYGYNYDDPARFFRVSKEDLFGKPNGPRSCDMCLHYTGQKPESNNDIENFIKKYKLHHGDIVCFGEYRDTDSYIVLRNQSEQLTWIENPDDSNSGYLTIPPKVLQYVKDAVGKYKCLLTTEHPRVKFHISPEDKFLISKIGPVPDHWEFILSTCYGDCESLSVCSPKQEWNIFQLAGEESKHIWTDLRKLLGVQPLIPKAEFTVHINLKGEQLRKYKEKYTLIGDRIGYPSATPDLPGSWTVSRGPGGSKVDRLFWVWHFMGKPNKKNQAIHAVESFLKGFEYKINKK